jgi:lipopolysaccharide transport system permease protein
MISRRSPRLDDDQSAIVVTINPARNWSLGLGDAWRSRELLRLLVWRDIKIRYKQTLFGAGWALIQPIMLMGVFGLFLGRLAGLPSDGLPYSLFVLSGLVAWSLFSAALSSSSRSIVSSQDLVSKVYFPRLVLPVAAAASFLVDFLVGLVLLICVAPLWGVTPTWRLVLVPLVGAFGLLSALSLGLWLAALNVRYRDIAYTVPFLIQVLMFASPIGYPSTLIPEHLRILYGLNPLAGYIETFRWVTVNANTSPFSQLGVSLAVTAILLLGGLVYFGRTQSKFADVI